jgi:hypothetical protein
MKIQNKKIIVKRENYDIIRKAFYENKLKLENDKEKLKLVSIINKIPLYDIYTDKVYFVEYKYIYYFHFIRNYKLFYHPDLDTKKLERKFLKHLYYDCSELGQNLTNCKKGTFVPWLKQIKPYYNKDEIIFLALNLGIIKKKDEKSIDYLCSRIFKKDISANEIEIHHDYILKKKMQTFIRNYSMFDAFFINKALRLDIYEDDIINFKLYKTYELLNNSPAFTSERIVYRFVKETPYLDELNVGDIYTTNSFISCTRNPFYNPDNSFGFILLKIYLPPKIKGVGLCIESYSLFPAEEEVLISPFCHFKLESVDKDFAYYHYNLEASNKIIKKFELSFVKKDKKEIKIKPKIDTKKIPILKLETIAQINDKASFFVQKYCNENKEFKIEIDGSEYIFYCLWYDSNQDSAYRDFFYYRVMKGLVIYMINPENCDLNYTFEYSQAEQELSINYYSKFTPLDDYLDEKTFMKIACTIAYIFTCKTIIIHPTFKSASVMNKEIQNDVFVFNNHLMEYIINNKKYFERFKYAFIQSINYDEIDSIRRNYSEYNLTLYPELKNIFLSLKTKTLGEFYKYICINNPELIKYFEESLKYDFNFVYKIEVRKILNIINIDEYNYPVFMEDTNMEYTRNQRI